jgi:predicted RNase H-like HicB family nuclease
MSVKRKNSSEKINRGFPREVLRRARAIAVKYQIILSFEDGEYFGRGLELPNVFGDGRSPDACVASTRKALTAAVAYLIEQGASPPAPASVRSRTEQINIRVTPEEKLLLAEAAQAKGFRGVGDFVRSATISRLKGNAAPR